MHCNGLREPTNDVSIRLVKNPPPAPGSLFLGVAIRSASRRDLTHVPKPNSISGKPTSRSATRHFKKNVSPFPFHRILSGGNSIVI